MNTKSPQKLSENEQIGEYGRIINSSDYIFMAKASEQAERYSEMKDYMLQFLKTRKNDTEDLTTEERSLLSVSYKNLIGSDRASFRVLQAEYQQEIKDNGPKSRKLENIRSLMSKVEKSVVEKCLEIIEIINSKLYPLASTLESKMVYKRNVSSYYNYISEVISDESEKKRYSTLSKKSDDEVRKILDELPPTNIHRLSFYLSTACFKYEIYGQKEEAIEMAQTAFDNAIPLIDELDEEEYREVVLVMQLLRDNLTKWVSETNDENV